MEQTFQKMKIQNMAEEMTLNEDTYSEGAESPKEEVNEQQHKFTEDIAMKQKMIKLEDQNLQLAAQL